jgi:hypothetical protein
VYLIQVLLPLYDNTGEALPRALHQQVSAELTERFGGLTAYSRAPAEGRWREGASGTIRDDIVVYEVMTSAIERAWWQTYRRDLEARFRQEQVVIRAQGIELL